MSAVTPTKLCSDRSRLLSLSNAMVDLARESMEPWFENGRDPMGGMFGFLDRSFRPVLDSESSQNGPSDECRGDKSLVQQARHLYCFSLLHRTRTMGVQDFARTQLEYLEDYFSRPGEAEFIDRVCANGKPREEPRQIYAQSFAVYGLSEYALSFGNEDGQRATRAAQRALACFRSWDFRLHDGTFGGYDQRSDGGWLSHVSAPEGSIKCTNTHIHLLEALTCLVDLFPRDAVLVSRLGELVDLICDRMLQPDNYLHQYFAEDWTPVGEPEVSYGHDLETSWLLREAAARIGGLSEKKANSAARRMANHALRTGWDEAGGVYDFGVPEQGTRAGRVVGREKVWWAQAEALPAIYRLYEQTHERSLIPRLEATFSFLFQKSRDPIHGGFYWSVFSDGSIGPRGDHKGEIWKTPYHALRALLLTSRWIRAGLSGSKPHLASGLARMV